MFYTRTTKTGSGAIAVQVVRYENRKKVIAIHIGSAYSETDILSLKKAAKQWIERAARQSNLFSKSDKKNNPYLLPLDKCTYLGIRYFFIYEILSRLLFLFKFHLFHNSLLTDMVLIRMVEPASKLRSLKLLERYFGITHDVNNLYRQLKKLSGLKNQAEDKIVAIAKKHFNFNFSLVFYDVTTLYFESFEPDDLRRCGFSKDNKSNQPQILIGLFVNTDGFPVAYEIFAGSKFEGHTFIPAITAFKNRHTIDRLVVVADAAMISFDNVTALKANNLKYIVGARLNNLAADVLKIITKKLSREDGATIRIKTTNGDLICGFSKARWRKDKRELERQINRAELALKIPSKIKRLKFVKNKTANKYELNRELIKKQQSLLGIKGYYTNLSKETNNQEIIRHYHSLWHVEQAFRIAKSDLQMRPIYHFKEQTIQTHVLICFMALAISKYIEIKTGKSIKHIITLLKDVTDARILNTLTNQEITLRSKIPQEVNDLIRKLDVWY